MNAQLELERPIMRAHETGNRAELERLQQQYRQGGYLNICLHPFVSGRALRVAMLDRLIARMKTLPGVWFATCEEVARHCLDKHPARRATV